MKEFVHALGVKAKDQITGYEGRITGRVEYLTGCRQYLVTGLARDGKPGESVWLDEDRLQTDGEPLTLSVANDGFDLPAPIR